MFHFQYIKENHPKLSQICSYGIFTSGLKNEFETTVIKRAISVRATEFLKYIYFDLFFRKADKEK